MVGGTSASISTSPPSLNPDDAGLIDRLVQRTTGPAGSKRLRQRNAGVVAGIAPKDPETHFRSLAAATALPNHAAPNAAAMSQSQPHQFHQQSRTSPPAEMPSAAPQPLLKKRASLRDRLKAWQKPPVPLPPETVADDATPRSVYEPKHAAADFSRLAVSPMSPTWPRPLLMQTLEEAEDSTLAGNVPYTHQQQRSRNRGRGYTIPQRGYERDEDPTRRHSSHSGSTAAANRRSYTLVQDAFQASQAAVHIPVSPRSAAWTTDLHSEESAPLPPSLSLSEPASDYELFLARAEADDRAYREKVLKSMSQRSAAAHVMPDPHRQYAAVGVAAVATEKGRNSGRYVLSGYGEQHHREKNQRAERRASASADKTRARKSGGSGSGTGSGGSAKRRAPAENSRSRPSEPVTHHQPVVYGVDYKFNREAHEYQPQPPRALRRQASLTQRFVEYIRPPKMAQAVGTVVE